ncbi:MAG: erythromycin esterase family protein [Rhodopila sp.]
MNVPNRFDDRTQAGRLLAERLHAMKLAKPVVFALPRGGVPVALEIAWTLNAPLDLLLVRKIGAPGQPELALGAVVEGEAAETVVNEDVRQMTGASDAYLERTRHKELAEIVRRRTLYLEGRARIDPAGCTAIVVDDGLATGATAKAGLTAIRRQGAARVVLAVPVAPQETLTEMQDYADEVVCLIAARQFGGVGAFYADFHQLTDSEAISLLRQAPAAHEADPPPGLSERSVVIPPLDLPGDLRVPTSPRGIVLFAHGSGSGRLSPRNVAVAQALNERGFATLLMDLLMEAEAHDRRNVFDIRLLAERLLEAALWIEGEPDIGALPLGLFGASTGAGAALMAAAELKERVAAVVSRGGRPDLAADALPRVTAPTLLIVGGEDHHVTGLNRKALEQLACDKRMNIVPYAGHLFEEPGTLDAVIELAAKWFAAHLQQATPRVVAGAPPAATRTVLREAAIALLELDNPGFAAAFDRFAGARVVLLGEASHGTSEFYRARAAITKKLIRDHGFRIVAVEADWPDAAAVDRYVRHKPHRKTDTPAFSRFPTWMWRNRDVHDFVNWLRNWNKGRPMEDRAGFYGLDLYNMNASMAAVLAYLDGIDPEAATAARARYACLTPFSHEPTAYGRAALTKGYALCEQPVTQTLLDLLRNELRYAHYDGEQFLDAEENARLVADAERYYRVMYYGSAESWNLRDRHMFDTLSNVLAHRGDGAKAVVWAHNSHIGDARATDMGKERGELNIGQLCRERFGQDAVLIGMGTDSGTVAAAPDWDAPMEVMQVRPSRPGSYESLCHAVGLEQFLLDFRAGRHEAARALLSAPRLERYIGVIYRPETELWSHYTHATLLEQYDAFVWFDHTTAVTPLPADGRDGDDGTYPFGL